MRKQHNPVTEMKPQINNYDKLENIHFGDVYGDSDKKESKSDKATHIGEVHKEAPKETEYKMKYIINIDKTK